MGFLLSFIEHEWHIQVLMGSIKQGGHIIFVLIFSMILYSSMARSSSDSRYDPAALEALFHSYANKTLSRHRTGDIYNISLPSNFTNVRVSVVRLRSWSFWSRGANFSFFCIPKRVVARPYAKRIAIVYDNLGNLSSYYYKVPNHSLVAPVVGFVGYDASNLSALRNEKLTFSVSNGNPILISFPQIELRGKNVTPKCVKFGAGGSVEFSNMTRPNLCVTQGAGHFSVVVPTPPRKDEKHWKLWVVGLVGGVCGLILLIVVGVTVYKVVRRRKIRKMESETEKGVAFDTFWIGRSRLPSASMIRTQPVLEHDYVP